MFEPIETGREVRWFHTNDVDSEAAPKHFNSEAEAIEGAIERLSQHFHDGDGFSNEPYSLDWQLYRRTIIHEVVETARGVMTSTTTTPIEEATVVRLTVIPAA